MSLKHAILGLLDLRPMSGYDLKKAFDGSVAHFWSADQAQIYRTLARLGDDGLVAVRVVEQRGRPDRHEHRLTDAGRTELSRWLRSPLAAGPERDPFLARLFFAGREDDPELVRTLLEDRRAAVRERLTVLSAVATRDDGLADRLRAATLRNGVRHLEAEAAWLDEVEGWLA